MISWCACVRDPIWTFEPGPPRHLRPTALTASHSPPQKGTQLGDRSPRTVREHPQMSNRATHRDLGPQFESSTRAMCTKMATATAACSRPHASTIDLGTEHRKVLTPATLIFTPLSHGNCQQVMTPSPTSTESLLATPLEIRLSPLRGLTGLTTLTSPYCLGPMVLHLYITV